MSMLPEADVNWPKPLNVNEVWVDEMSVSPPPSALPRLFERFFRAEPSRSRELGGSGLGLAICKTLIEAHGGRIAAAQSKLGGLSIRIELPLERSV